MKYLQGSETFTGPPHFVSLWVQDDEDQSDPLTRTLRGLAAGQASLRQDVAQLLDGHASLRGDMGNLLGVVGHHISHALMGVHVLGFLQCVNMPRGSLSIPSCLSTCRDGGIHDMCSILPYPLNACM